MSELTTEANKEGDNKNMSEDNKEIETVRTSRLKVNSNDITMHDYFERICSERSQRVSLRLKGIEDMLKLRFEMQDKATELSNKNLETRLDKLNELRSEVIQDRSRFISYEKYDAQYKLLENKLDIQNKSLENKLDIQNKSLESKLDIQNKSLENKLDLQYTTLDNRITKLEMWQNKMYGIAIGIGLVSGISGGLIAKIFA